MIAPKMINNVIAKGCMRNINKYHHRRQNYLRDIIRCSKNNHNNLSPLKCNIVLVTKVTFKTAK